MTQQDFQHIKIRIPRDILARVRVIAEYFEISTAELIRGLLEELLKNRELECLAITKHREEMVKHLNIEPPKEQPKESIEDILNKIVEWIAKQ